MARRNLCPNPSAKNNATGYSGTSSPARVTAVPTPASPRSTGMAATGSGYIQCPAAACAAGDVFTVSFYAYNNGAFTEGSKTVFVAYTRSAGGDTFPETFSVTMGAAGNTVRASFTAAAAPANATGIYLLWDNLGAGHTMSAVLLEKVGALDTYADGDTSGWAWDGTDGNSTSSQSGITGVNPTGIAVPVALGSPTVSLNRTAAPNGIAVPVALGNPSATAGAFPAGLAVPVRLATPCGVIRPSADPISRPSAAAVARPSNCS